MARNTKNQNSPYRERAIPSHDTAPELPNPANPEGPNATSAAYVVNTYSRPTPSVASSTARGTVRRGSRASSASGAAPSNPPKASIVYTEPATTPETPWNAFGAKVVVNTAEVLWCPACTMKKTASTRKTAISVTPRIVPSRAEVLIP